MGTNYETVIDSYAWIEYFRGSSSGDKARQFKEKGICCVFDNCGRVAGEIS